MRIAIDLTAVRSAGTTLYMREFLGALDQVDVEHDYLVFLPNDLEGMGGSLSDNFIIQRVKFAHQSTLRVIWEQSVFPILLSRWQVSVLLAPFDIAPLLCTCPVVLAVRNPAPHQINNYRYEMRLAFRLRTLRWLTFLSGLKAFKVIFPSGSAASSLGDRLRVPKNKRVVIYHGLNLAFWSQRTADQDILSRYGLADTPYILFASGLYRQKCVETLIQGFAHWLQTLADKCYRLVLAGVAVEQSYYRSLRQQVSDLGLEQWTLFLGQVPHTDMPSLYRSAAAFVLPSLLETFGFPYVEAMASGVPIICADIPTAREICGEAALYFPPRDSLMLAHCLAQVVGGPDDLRKELITRGQERAKLFSWEREARETRVLLEEAGIANLRGRRGLL